MKTLPDKPSELLKLAMHDLELCEQDEKYEINMIIWHSFFANKCYVCMAGAVMAKSLKCEYRDIYPSNFNNQTENKLDIINNLRVGDFGIALKSLGIELPSSIPPTYCEMLEDDLPKLEIISRINRPKWKLHMATIIGILEAENL